MHRLTLAAGLGLAAIAFAQPSDAPTRAAPLAAEEQERLLYALGVTMGRSVESFALTPEELAVVARGLKEWSAPQVEVESALASLKEFELRRRDQRLAQEKARGRAYAAKAAQEKGAEVTPSGLVYLPLSEGVGPAPSAADTVRVHYRGRLIDGREFDSSYRTGQPLQIGLGSVIPCWTEAIPKLKTHGRARLVCPSSIAYGDRGRPPTIPPGATLVFDVELMDVVLRGSTTVR
jgi:FKBP-type peptidyl-prolyl cis-trans isomerase FkpA